MASPRTSTFDRSRRDPVELGMVTLAIIVMALVLVVRGLMLVPGSETSLQERLAPSLLVETNSASDFDRAAELSTTANGVHVRTQLQRLQQQPRPGHILLEHPRGDRPMLPGNPGGPGGPTRPALAPPPPPGPLMFPPAGDDSPRPPHQPIHRLGVGTAGSSFQSIVLVHSADFSNLPPRSREDSSGRVGAPTPAGDAALATTSRNGFLATLQEWLPFVGSIVQRFLAGI